MKRRKGYSGVVRQFIIRVGTILSRAGGGGGREEVHKTADPKGRSLPAGQFVHGNGVRDVGRFITGICKLLVFRLAWAEEVETKLNELHSRLQTQDRPPPPPSAGQ